MKFYLWHNLIKSSTALHVAFAVRSLQVEINKRCPLNSDLDASEEYTRVFIPVDIFLDMTFSSTHGVLLFFPCILVNGGLDAPDKEKRALTPVDIFPASLKINCRQTKQLYFLYVNNKNGCSHS